MSLPLNAIAADTVSLAFDLASDLVKACTYSQRTDAKYDPATGRQGTTLAAPTNLQAAVAVGSPYESLNTVTGPPRNATSRHKVRVYSFIDIDGDPDQRQFSATYIELEINLVPFSAVTVFYGITWTWDAVPGATGYRVLIDEEATDSTDAIADFAKGWDVLTNSLAAQDAEPWDIGMSATTPTYSNSPTDVTAQVSAMKLSFKAKEIDGQQIKSGDERFLIRAVDLGAIDPDEDDTLIDDVGVNWQVIAFRLDATRTLYTFQMRKVSL